MRIKELREEHRLTQKELAEKIGVAQSNISRWEKEEMEPAAGFVIKLADYFAVSADYLLGRTDDLGNIVVQSGSDFATSPAEQRLVLDFRRLPPDTQSYVIGIVKNLAAAS